MGEIAMGGKGGHPSLTAELDPGGGPVKGLLDELGRTLGLAPAPAPAPAPKQPQWQIEAGA